MATVVYISYVIFNDVSFNKKIEYTVNDD